MTLDSGTVSIAVIVLGALVIVLVAWVAALQRAQLVLRRRLRRIAAGEGDGIDEVLDRALARIDGLAQRVDALNALHHELAALTQRTIQRVGVVRFNPFADTGGDQSFAIALLDADGDGLVLSSLHSRTDTRLFAKRVAGGRSSHQLSDEEQEAIRLALAQTR